MKLTYSDILGEEAVVSYSTDPSLIGKRGIIVGEGKNTLRMLNGKKEIKMLKWNVSLKIMAKNGRSILVSGTDILGRPEERTKEIVRRKKR